MYFVVFELLFELNNTFNNQFHNDNYETSAHNFKAAFGKFGVLLVFNGM